MQNILVIQLSRMGDIIQTVPLLLSLQRAYPSALITLVCIKEFIDILSTFGLDELCAGIPASFVKDLQSATRPDAVIIDKVIQAARLTRRFDLAINCNYETGAAALLSKIDAVEKRGRILEKDMNPCLLGDWSRYQFSLTKKRIQNLFNMADIYQGLAGTIGAGKYLAPFINENDRVDAKGLLRSYGYTGKTNLVAFQLGTRDPPRSWGVAEFAAVAKNLLTREDVSVAIIGGPADSSRASEFMSLVKRPILNLVGKTTLKNLPSILAQCRLLITNDTGPMHIANLAGVRILSIHVASAYFAETAPYGEGHILVHADCDCYPCLPTDLCADMRCKEQIAPNAISIIAHDMINSAIPPAWNLPGISMYQTAFLDNHTLGFIPKSEKISLQFIQGFLHRIAWENLLGLSSDDLYIYGIADVLRRMNTLSDAKSALQTQLMEFDSGLNCCSAAIQNMTSILSLGTPNPLALQNAFSDLKNTIAGISGKQDSPIGFFHSMDFSRAGSGDIKMEMADLLSTIENRIVALQSAEFALKNLTKSQNVAGFHLKK